MPSGWIGRTILNWITSSRFFSLRHILFNFFTSLRFCFLEPGPSSDAQNLSFFANRRKLYPKRNFLLTSFFLQAVAGRNEYHANLFVFSKFIFLLLEGDKCRRFSFSGVCFSLSVVYAHCGLQPFCFLQPNAWRGGGPTKAPQVDRWLDPSLTWADSIPNNLLDFLPHLSFGDISCLIFFRTEVRSTILVPSVPPIGKIGFSKPPEVPCRQPTAPRPACEGHPPMFFAPRPLGVQVAVCRANLIVNQRLG